MQHNVSVIALCLPSPTDDRIPRFGTLSAHTYAPFMRSRVYEKVERLSVRPSVSLSVRIAAAGSSPQVIAE